MTVKIKKGRFSEFSGNFTYGDESDGGVPPYEQAPEALGPANAGTADEYSRGNHRHPHGNLSASGDYPHDSDQIENKSTQVVADTVTEAIDALAAGGGGAPPYTLPPQPLGTPSAGGINNYSRGDHVHAHGNLATSGNYPHDSDQIENTSTVAGTTVADALDTLAGGTGPAPYNTNPEPLGTASPGNVAEYARGNHVHEHGNLATSANYPHDSDQIENTSTVLGSTVSDALDQLLAGIVAGAQSWLYQARGIVQYEVFYRGADVVITTSNPADLQNAITAASSGQVIEVAADAVFSPVIIPAGKKLTIRVRAGYVARMSGTNCVKLANGAADLVFSGFNFEGYNTADVNGRGAGVCFDQDLSRASRIILHACNFGEVTNGSAVLLAYRVGGGYAGQYTAATQSDRFAALACNFGLACKDGNEGAALLLRGWDYPAIGDCNLRGGAQALAATDRGVSLLACRYGYVQGCNSWTWYHPTNGEAFKLDWFGTPDPDFRCSALFENCNAANCGEGFDVDDGSDAVIRNCVATHAHLSGSGDGFDVDDNGRAVLAGCVARDCDRGFNLEVNAVTELENCEAYGCTLGYLISNGYSLPSSNTTTATREDNGNLAAVPSDATPQPPGVAAPGTSPDYSRADHVHASPGGAGSLAYAGIYSYFPDTGGAVPGPFLTGPGWFGLFGVHGPSSGIVLTNTPTETIFTVPATGIYRCGITVCWRNQDGHRYELAILVNTGFVNQATYGLMPIALDPDRDTIAIDTLIALNAGDQVTFSVRDRDWVGVAPWAVYAFQAVMHQLDGLPGGFSAAYGWAQENTADPGSTIALATQGTYYPWITATLSSPLRGVTFGKDAVNGDFLQVAAPGDYAIASQVSFQGTVSQTFEFAPFVNGADPGTIGCERKLGTGGDVGSASFNGILTLAANAKITMHVRCLSANGASVGVHRAQLSINRIG